MLARDLLSGSPLAEEQNKCNIPNYFYAKEVPSGKVPSTGDGFPPVGASPLSADDGESAADGDGGEMGSGGFGDDEEENWCLNLK